MAAATDYCLEELEQLLDNLAHATPDEVSVWLDTYSERDRLEAIRYQLHRLRSGEQFLLALLTAPGCAP